MTKEEIEDGNAYLFYSLHSDPEKHMSLHFVGASRSIVGSERHGAKLGDIITRLKREMLRIDYATKKLYPDHKEDVDCFIDPDTDSCLICNVVFGDPCPEKNCGGQAFHTKECVFGAL